MTSDATALYKELRPHFQDRVRRDELLAHHSALGVGGPADLWIAVASREELLDLVRLCAQEHMPLLIAGNGTNVLFANSARFALMRAGSSSFPSVG